MSFAQLYYLEQLSHYCPYPAFPATAYEYVYAYANAYALFHCIRSDKLQADLKKVDEKKSEALENAGDTEVCLCSLSIPPCTLL